MTPDQERAGLAIMKGTFRFRDVRQALQRANIPIDQLEAATTTLLRRQRELGNIRHEKIEDMAGHENDQWIKVR